MKTLTAAALLLVATSALAGKADVEDVRVECMVTCTFNVTVRHSDTGWKHYADRWEVLAPDGTALGVRTLYHPHVNEQPFTRSLAGVKIDRSIQEVTLRARDSKHGWGGKEIRVKLPPH
ncbi:MAG: hypothetical protein P8171_15135 [Candidatus Thiodiazotropha sp.]